MTTTPFLPGLTLNRRFFEEVVQPLLAREFPGLVYSAALIGYGSDVLGFDTPQSTDHNWGPRLQLFIPPGDYAQSRDAIDQMLRAQLPITFLGYSVNFSEPDLSDGGTQSMEAVETGPVRHMIEIRTLDAYFRRYLGVAPDTALTPLDWLMLPQQQLLEITAGEVYHDGLGTLEAARARFAWFPRDVWLYRMRTQWARIAQEEAFVGRTGQAGDDLGSRIVAARVVRDLMFLAFLQERRYAPYSKWLGTAFSRLSCAATLTPLFEATLTAPDWQTRQQPLAEAYKVLATTHNTLNVTPPVDPTTRPFFNRPFQVLFAGRFADALRDAIENAPLRNLPAIGAVDQFVDSTDLADDPALVTKLRAVFT